MLPEFPKKKPVTKISMEIETELLNQIKKYCKKESVTFREVVEYCLAKFLEETEK